MVNWSKIEPRHQLPLAPKVAIYIDNHSLHQTLESFMLCCKFLVL